MARQMDVFGLYDRNPAYGSVFDAMLAFCAQQRSEADVMQAIDESRTSKSQIQSASSIVELMVAHEALTRTIIVDGEPYAGTPRDLETDADVPEDASIERFYQTTENAVAYTATHSAPFKIAALLETAPQRAGGFRMVLDACSGAGASTCEVQTLLHDAGLLEPDARTGAETIHASYYTGALEQVGALVWKQRRWITTEEGAHALAGMV